MDLAIRTPTFSDFEAMGDMMDYDDGSTVPPRPQLRAPVIPKPAWEAHRIVIEKLYIDDGLKLSEVLHFMKLHYGFVASVQMYKKRLEKWKVRKNYSQDQKLEIMRKLAALTASGEDPVDISLNGKPLKRDRLRRRVQRNG